MGDDASAPPSAAPVAARPRPRRPVAPAASATDLGPGRGAREKARTRVKVCGITRLDDAELAVREGAWAIGMILWSGSKRRCRPDDAERIGAALKRRVEVAGVFVNATLDEVVAAVDRCGLTIVQLHGDEGPSYCAEVGRRTGAKVVKAARVRTGADVTALRPFRTDFHLLDTHVEGQRGGTGRSFDWDLARVRRAAPGEKQPPLILSGGLTAENVAEAVRTTTPYAVDVAGGTEAAPGRKDPERVRAFVAAVRGAFDPPEDDGGVPSGTSAPAGSRGAGGASTTTTTEPR